MSEPPPIIEREQFEAFEATILSGQVAPAELGALLAANPEFDSWYRARAAKRQRS